MIKYDGLLLASGGMDSTVLAYNLANKGKKILLLFLNYGQHCMVQEYETLKKVAPSKYNKNIKVINIADIYNESSSRMIREPNLWVDDVKADDLFLPYRNLLFLSIASAYAQSKGIKTVYSAFIDSNHAKEIDCSMEFFKQLEVFLKEYGSVKICMPFRKKTKTQVAKLGIKLKAPIAITYSCQANSKTPCGACPNCIDRINAVDNLLKGVLK